jgi:hypothetical protein
MSKHAIMEETFSVWSVPGLYNEDQQFRITVLGRASSNFVISLVRQRTFI